MHRSGSSALTRLLNMSGAYFGSEGKSILLNDENPKGFWERRDVRNINDLLLYDQQCDWDRPLGFSANNLSDPVQSLINKYMPKFVLEMDAHRPWLIKEPRICLTFPIWERFLSSPIKVLIYRDPLECAKSLQKRNNIPLEAGLDLWCHYNDSALAHMSDRNSYTLSYNTLLENPTSELTKLVDFLSQRGVRRLVTPSEQEIGDFIDLKYYRNRNTSVEYGTALPQHVAYTLKQLQGQSDPSQKIQNDYVRLNNYQRDKTPNQEECNQLLKAKLDAVGFANSRAPETSIQEILMHSNNLAKENKKLYKENLYFIESNKQLNKERKKLVELLEIEKDRTNRMANSGSWKYTSIFRSMRRGFMKLNELISSNTNTLKPRNSCKVTPPKSLAIVICVHNALDDVKITLESVVHNLYQSFELILIDDGSDEPTKEYLDWFSKHTGYTTLIRNDKPKGYTRSANIGLKTAKSDFCLLMNSDVILTKQAISLMLKCFDASSRIALVGPLSNAASYQSIPELSAKEGGWSLNPLPEGWTPQTLADELEANIQPSLPEVPILNGFCTMIRSAIFQKIGHLDEQAFPLGYGEENDFCLRAQKAKYKLVVADNAYVFHAKSKSFGSTRRSELNQKGNKVLYERYGVNTMKEIGSQLKNNESLALARKEAKTLLSKQKSAAPSSIEPELKRILYLLPAKGGGGGAHSVIQEAEGLNKLGVFTRVAVPLKYKNDILHHYPNVDQRNFLYYATQEELYTSAQNFNVCIATIFITVKWLKEIIAKFPYITPAYYIQDYEPWFNPDGSPLNIEASNSYNLIPGMVRFAKTDWIIQQVKKFHDATVKKVCPSIDHSTYFPANEITAEDRIVISAMIRPRTSRRNAPATMTILKLVKQELGDQVDIHIFGAEASDPDFKALDRTFSFTNHGICERSEVASILQKSDIFVDFSTYQAFGRTGLEAMACKTAVVLPLKGGVHEYAVDTQNALLVDTQDTPSMLSALKSLITDEALRNTMKDNGLKTAQCYTVQKACESIKEVLISENTTDEP